VILVHFLLPLIHSNPRPEEKECKFNFSGYSGFSGLPMEMRPIDKKRESAGSFKLQTDEDGAGITEMFQLSDGMVLATGTALYEVRTADQIDPKRTNPNIPHNLQRRILSLGTESELVGRTLMTAKALFVEKFLPPVVDAKKAMSLTFEALKDLVAMDAATNDFIATEKKEIEKMALRSPNPGSFALPSVTDVETRCKTFFQKADHVEQALWDIARLFYPTVQAKCHFEKLLELAEKDYGSDDGFPKFLRDALPFLLMGRHIRDCLDHRNAKGVVITNFAMQPDGKIIRPSIEVNFRGTKQPKVEIGEFLPPVVKCMLNVFDTMIAFLCGKNPRATGFPIQVGFVQEANRRNKFVQYSFGIIINGEFQPIE
jgi:hypothetical protein